MAKKYNHIRAWGKLLGSYEYYIKDQQALAEADGAPLNAIYKGDDGWVTVDDLTNKQTSDIVRRMASDLKYHYNKLMIKNENGQEKRKGVRK